MSDQLSLFGVDDARKPASPRKGPAPRKEMPKFRLFFGLFPGAAQAAPIAGLGARLRAMHGLKGGLLADERLHVTSHDLGGYDVVPEELIAQAMTAAATVSERQFDVVFDQAMSFPTSGAYVLCGSQGVAELVAFRQRLGVAMAEAGLVPKRDFKAHMTLLYDKRTTVALHAVEPLRWRATEFVLVKSHVGLTRHEALGRWPLVG
jgi:RNA 2',3'-cyclic 3'-phosphodiesterase